MIVGLRNSQKQTYQNFQISFHEPFILASLCMSASLYLTDMLLLPKYRAVPFSHIKALLEPFKEPAHLPVVCPNEGGSSKGDTL